MTAFHSEVATLLATATQLLQQTTDNNTQKDKETTMNESIDTITPTATAQTETVLHADTAEALTPQRASELYTGGQSVIEIARAFGLTYAKTRKILAATNTPIRDASSRLKGRPRAKKTVDA